MNILVLNYEFPPLGGGASPVSYEICKGYIKLGHRVDVITMGYKDLPEFEVMDGINVHRMKCLRRRLEISYPWEQLSYVFAAKQFLSGHLRKNKYDVNHTHFVIPSGIVSYWIKKHFNIPYIITAHGSDIPEYNPDRFKFLHKFTGPVLRKVISGAERVVSPSRYLLRLINSNVTELGEKGIVIPNGIRIGRFNSLEKRKVILSTGRLLRRKGFQYLIKAVRNEDIGYEVRICGDGPMMDELKMLAKHSKTRVIFHGWLDNNSPEYKELLETASIYCLVSLRENASISLLEAMLSGCAVVTSNVSGCPETVSDAGIIINPESEKELREALTFLIADEKRIKSYSELAKERINNIYDWNKLFKRYENELTKLLN